MTRERFAEILREYDFTEAQIDLLWRTRPFDNLSEPTLRVTAVHMKPIKDVLTQE